jgi:hypothetical protein
VQYFTSAQLLAQRLRQLIGRPQATQGLLGNAALLPRKPVLCPVIFEPRGRGSVSDSLRLGKTLREAVGDRRPFEI